MYLGYKTEDISTVYNAFSKISQFPVHLGLWKIKNNSIKQWQRSLTGQAYLGRVNLQESLKSNKLGRFPPLKVMNLSWLLTYTVTDFLIYLGEKYIIRLLNLIFCCLKITSFKVKVKSLSRLCDPKVCSLPGFSVHRILQARVLEWVAISFSRGSSWCRNQTQVSHIACRRFTLWATRVKSIFNYSILFLITTFISPGIRRTCSLHIWDK